MALFGSKTRNAVVDDYLDIKIKEFSSTDKIQRQWTHEANKRNGDLLFSISVSPNGIGKRSTGDVLVKVNEVRYSEAQLSESHDVLRWTVSVVDQESNLRFPRSFTRTPSNIKESLADMQLVDFIGEKYLERSFLLSRAEELLPDDTLTLRFEISYICHSGTRKKQNEEKLKRSSSVGDFPSLDFYQQTCWHDFVPTTREITAIKKKGDQDPGSEPNLPTYEELFSLKFSDMAIEISHSPLSCGDHHWTVDDSRENCGCVLVPSIMPSDDNNPSSRFRGVECLLEENYTDFAENDWIFRTNPDKYLISMDPDANSFGSKLMEASPVIRSMVNSPMAEMRQKCINLHSVASQTFFNLLFYLENRILFFETFSDAFELYRVAHMYQMEDLLLVCADCMAKSFNPNIIDDVKRVADFFSDEHLWKLIESYCNAFRNSTPVSKPESSNVWV
ncbi:unnamed protein product [Larinioides sclopetarius]|uniref:BTB/POZ domain-containing protein n=1 Tax=Larinioides sclopetarius TaxID=280406 RepID=A0AAV1ZWU9_9ARAC